jgi:hypothetical protein
MAAITIALLASPSATHEIRRIGRRAAAIHVNIGESSDAAPQDASDCNSAVRWGYSTSAAGACLSCTMLLQMA